MNSQSVNVGLLILVTLQGVFSERILQHRDQKGSNMTYNIWKREETVYIRDDVEATSGGGMSVREGKKD